MALTINTNVSSIIAQRNLNSATTMLNTAIERMTTGYKINHAQDNAAGYSISKLWNTQLSSLDVAADNVSTGVDMLTTAEDTYTLLTSHLQRIRDLTEQAANGTYGSQSAKAIQAEIVARMQEINRISANAEFNGIKLMSYTDGGDNSEVGITKSGVTLQVGLYANDNSQINLPIELFTNASLHGLFGELGSTTLNDGASTFADLLTSAGADIADLNTATSIQGFAAACSGLVYAADGSLKLQSKDEFRPKELLNILDMGIQELSTRSTSIGAVQNRLSSALSALDIQSQNITSSLSTLRDADVAEESSNYIKAQILQQASATLLSTANQLPSIALNLI